VLATADDCSLPVKDGDIVVFEKRMINKIQIEDKQHYLILENYIFGRI
jgi:co-chaperonin GroES (HSP10)